MELTSYAALPPEAVRWLANGARGVSSDTLFSIIYGVEALPGSLLRSAPSDPSDFRRCRLMVDGIPGARERLMGIVDVRAHGHLRAQILSIVNNWDALCGLMDSETPEWRNPPPGTQSPKLYRVMHEMADDEVRAKRNSLSEDDFVTITGADEVDILRGQFRDPTKSSLDAITSKQQMRHFIAFPVVDSKIGGEAAAALLKHCVVYIGQITANIKSGPANVAASNRAGIMLESFAGLDNVPAPKSERSASQIRSHLERAMIFLWKESHHEFDSDQAKTTRKMFAMMSGQLALAAKEANAATSTESTSSASSPKARSATPA